MAELLAAFGAVYLLAGAGVAMWWVRKLSPHRPSYRHIVVTWPIFLKRLRDVRNFSRQV